MARIELLEAPSLEALAAFGAIIDVRSPAEFAEDHLPGALNLPVLDDAERAEVGTIYVQESRLKANRMGAAYVARNIARHLETGLADKPAEFAPLVYCWRGGQRSNAMATILSQIGWRPTVLAGGYRTYRRLVRATLYDAPWPTPIVLLDGDTGTGKTEILKRMAQRGGQVIDLEGLAEHRGSVLGDWSGQPQPSQKMFESRIWSVLQRLDPARPVVMEAESSKIGERMLPPALWRAMQSAPRIEISAPLPARARYLVEAYGDLVVDRNRFADALARLPTHLARTELDAWRELFDQGDFLSLAQAIVAAHYDPAYARGRRRAQSAPIGLVTLPDLAPADQEAAVDAILATVERANR
ncbi:MAG: rhodanese-like protein [Phenylobacterium sp.]|nr:rhodanese-like protein [Phenylobacterium sp.]